ncbi:hypothetical protein WJX84_009263 [Apatococcus fuscideae]|uniref:Single-stranded DNA binding protein Ssb-like OB fold domain-containing protein n=1 Tax=Apatococcus fuscideae TaxID=2026836 RepID=A0AAW1SX74_9CHLO
MSHLEPLEAEEEHPTTTTSVDALRPDTEGHNLTVKVLSSHVVVTRPGRNPSANATTITESLVGDESGVVIFTARNDQVELVKPGKILALKGAKVDMFKGSLRLMVPNAGSIESLESSKLEPKVDNNVSLIEYELVPIVAN